MKEAGSKRPARGKEKLAHDFNAKVPQAMRVHMGINALIERLMKDYMENGRIMRQRKRVKDVVEDEDEDEDEDGDGDEEEEDDDEEVKEEESQDQDQQDEEESL